MNYEVSHTKIEISIEFSDEFVYMFRMTFLTDLKQEMKVRVTGNTTNTTEKPPTRKFMAIKIPNNSNVCNRVFFFSNLFCDRFRQHPKW